MRLFQLVIRARKRKSWSPPFLGKSRASHWMPSLWKQHHCTFCRYETKKGADFQNRIVRQRLKCIRHCIWFLPPMRFVIVFVSVIVLYCIVSVIVFYCIRRCIWFLPPMRFVIFRRLVRWITGLPDGIFSNQKYQFGYILEGLAMEGVGILNGRSMVYSTPMWSILWHINGHLA
jgi:hypothetical protein